MWKHEIKKINFIYFDYFSRGEGKFNDIMVLDSEFEFPEILVINNFKAYRKFEGFLAVKT
jgi:hypothetical protein